MGNNNIKQDCLKLIYGKELFMGKLDSIIKVSRRRFVTSIVPACGLSCLGFTGLLASGGTDMSNSEKPKIHKFQKDCHLTYEEYFEAKFGYYIEIMEQFAEHLGRDELIDMIKRAADDTTPPAKIGDPDYSFRDWLQGGKDAYSNMMTWEIVEESDTVYEMKVSECLWWKIFKKHNATDIGYATVCHTDFSYARSVHPKLRLERSKSLMEGHNCCNHRWTFKD